MDGAVTSAQTASGGFSPRWRCCWDFVGDKALAASELGYFVLDSSGKTRSKINAFDIHYFNAWPNDWDCFRYLFDVANRILVGFMNWKGEVVFHPRYRWMTNFFQGVAGFCDAEDDTASPFGLVTDTGRIIASPRFFHLTDFECGLARAGRSLKEFGFINPEGDWVIEPHYRQVQPFSEGLACVTVAGKKGFINTRGEMIIEARFDRESSFHHGFARVQYEGKHAVINREGKIIWESEAKQE